MFIAAICFATWLLAVANTIFSPSAHHLECADGANSRGWPSPVVWVTRATQHFTLFGQVCLAVALATESHVVCDVALAVETLVAVMYHGLVFADPQLLSWHDPELVRRATGLLPPVKHPRAFLAWFALHFQHTVCPALAWLALPDKEFKHLDTVILVLFAFLAWNLFCWLVQGKPAYPLQLLPAWSYLTSLAAVVLAVCYLCL